MSSSYRTKTNALVAYKTPHSKLMAKTHANKSIHAHKDRQRTGRSNPYFPFATIKSITVHKLCIHNYGSLPIYYTDYIHKLNTKEYHFSTTIGGGCPLMGHNLVW